MWLKSVGMSFWNSKHKGKRINFSTVFAIFVLFIDLCEKGAEVNVQVYNAMLRVKLENKQPFSPVEVLSELEMEKHLLPNRVSLPLWIMFVKKLFF